MTTLTRVVTVALAAGLAAGLAGNDQERRVLNPQPLPPREAGATLQRNSPDARSTFGGPAQRRLVR